MLFAAKTAKDENFVWVSILCAFGHRLTILCHCGGLCLNGCVGSFKLASPKATLF